MKKLLISLLIASILFICTIVPSTIAFEEQASLPIVSITKQLKAHENFREFWIPLPTKNISFREPLIIKDNGSYGLSLAPKKVQGAVIHQISIVTAQNSDARLSPYQVMLSNKNLTKVNPCSVTHKNLNSIACGDTISYVDNLIKNQYIATGYTLLGTYDTLPAAMVSWNYSGHNQGDISSGQSNEVIIQLSDQILVSIILSYDDDFTASLQHASEFFSRIEEIFSLHFTTIGDANADGTVNAIDALAILKHSVGTASITDELTFLLCDADENNRLDAEDALFALKRAVGK